MTRSTRQLNDHTAAGKAAVGSGPVVTTVIDQKGPSEAISMPLGRSTFFSACFSIICCILGVGVLGMPYGLRQTGWSGVFILLLAWLMCTYTGVLLAKPFAQDPLLTDYASLGQKSMGKTGRYLASVSTNVTCGGICIIFLIIAGKFTHALLPQAGLTSTQWTALCAVVLWPFCFLRTLNETFFIAVIGVITSLVAITCILIGDVMSGRQPNVKYGNITFASVMAGFSKFAFAFSGHTVFPSIQRVMRRPERFSAAVMVSLTCVLVLYATVAIVNYALFGQDISSDIFVNLSPANSTVALIGRVAITLHLLFAFVVVINPVFHAIETHIGLGPEIQLFGCCSSKISGEVDGQLIGSQDGDDKLSSISSNTLHQRRPTSTQVSSSSEGDNSEEISTENESDTELEKTQSGEFVKNSEAEKECCDESSVSSQHASGKKSKRETREAVEAKSNNEMKQSGKQKTEPMSTAEASINSKVSSTSRADSNGEHQSVLHRLLPDKLRRFSLVVLFVTERTIVLGIFCFIAVMVPFFLDMMSLIGGTSNTLAIFILPVLFSFYNDWKELSLLKKLIGFSILIISIVAGVTSTVFAIMSIVETLQSSGYEFLG